jgi:hypothetical protein
VGVCSEESGEGGILRDKLGEITQERDMEITEPIWELIAVESDNVATLRDPDDWGHLLIVYPNGEMHEFNF